MTPEEWGKVRGILERVLELAPEHRAEYLESACSGDPALRSEVDSLIASDLQARTDFLEPAAFAAPMADGFSGSAESAAGRRIGAYQIVEEIGQGGMGSVYRAIRADDQYRKQVAIKLVRGGVGDAFRRHRFKAERQILANLDHPNIARLLDGGALEDGQPYVVMEYIQGQPIDKFCDSRGLPVPERLQLFRTVCSAVAYAHQHLVIHRDLKPDNILVTDAGEPKLLDFGIAKILDADDPGGSGNATVTVLRPMTPEYASPEQVRGQPMTTASDVYSLGVVLYGLLTGQRPYAGSSRVPHEIAQAVCEAQPEKPSTAVDREDATPDNREKLRRRLKGDLDNIVLKALRKEPERRYASVEQFSEDIRRHLKGLPVIARPDTFWYRTGKFVNRNKASVAGVALAIAALVAGLLIALRQTYVARAERARAEQRFNDVRALANSLLFEVHDAIQNLPGSTTARKLIVDRALGYLDALAKEAKGNLSLQRELAAAYQKVGDVQGGFREANLGDTAGALVSYRKSLAILEAVAAGDPSNVEAERELIRAHGKLSDILMLAGDRAGAIQQSKQLVAIAERLSSADPGNQAERRNLALAYLDFGSKRADKDQWQAALEDCQKALPLLESVVAAGDKKSRRLLALAYSRNGDLLSRFAHRRAESLAMHQKAVDLVQSMLVEDPDNVDLRRIEAWEILLSGDEIGAGGDAGAALEKYRAALKHLRALSAADVNDVQVQVLVAIATGRLGSAFLQQGNAKAALVDLENSLVQGRRFSKPRSANADLVWTLALDQFQMGQAHALLASDARLPASARREQWQQALECYRRSLPDLTAAANGIFQEMAQTTLKEAQSEMAKCEQELSKSSANRH
ncbi:MAG TPA: protein kinase [Bryobacteraceae bacterium]|nr:protein kinase [Bryobacteraceae bacterium]